MIKSISTNSPFITVSGGNPGSTYIGNYSNAPGVGNMRYNPNNQNIEVFDGSAWIILSAHHAIISLDPQVNTLLEWAKKKMLEEAERNKLAEINPAINDLMNQIKDKEEQIKIVQTLIKEEEKV